MKLCSSFRKDFKGMTIQILLFETNFRHIFGYCVYRKIFRLKFSNIFSTYAAHAYCA